MYSDLNIWKKWYSGSKNWINWLLSLYHMTLKEPQIQILILILDQTWASLKKFWKVLTHLFTWLFYDWDWQWLPPIVLEGGMGKENQHPHLNSALHTEQKGKELHQEDTTPPSMSWLAQARSQVSKPASQSYTQHCRPHFGLYLQSPAGSTDGAGEDCSLT